MPDDFLMKGTPSQVLRLIIYVLRGVNYFFDETGVATASCSKCSSKSEAIEHSDSHSLPDPSHKFWCEVS